MDTVSHAVEGFRSQLLQAHEHSAIGGADGTLGRGMQWQGMSLWMTLRYGKTPWITSSYIPTLAGRLFFLSELAGPLVAECN